MISSSRLSRQLDEPSSEYKSRSNNGEFQLRPGTFVSQSPSSAYRRMLLHRLGQISFFHSSIKHHYIFITRRQMTETESEGERRSRQQHRRPSGVSLSVCHFKPDFHPLLLQKTQLYKSSKWIFDLTMLHLIAILEVPQTYSRGHRRTLRTGPQSGADGGDPQTLDFCS